jgi:hypothetical protein
VDLCPEVIKIRKPKNPSNLAVRLILSLVCYAPRIHSVMCLAVTHLWSERLVSA